MVKEFDPELDSGGGLGLLDPAHEVGGDDELRMAARAGLILLEKNAALEVDVELLSTEIHRYEVQHRELSFEVEALRKQRKNSVMEVQAAHKEIKSLHMQLLQQRSASQSAEQTFLAQIRTLTSELHAITAKNQAVLKKQESEVSPEDHGNQSDDNEEVVVPEPVEDPRIAELQDENMDLQNKLQQAVQDLREREVEWTNSTHTKDLRIQSLEHEVLKLSRENKMLKEEQAEEREIMRSLRTMADTYKKIADARPFSHGAASEAGRSSATSVSEREEEEIGSMHEDVMQMNAALQERIKELEARLEKAPKTSAELDAHVLHLEDQLTVTRDMLKATKQQWISAVTAKKEAQACALAAHEEMARLQEALQVHMRTSDDKAGADQGSSSVDWMEDSEMHPAPPGDLDSPLIGCLLQNWTADKDKWDQLAQWLQGVIHGHPSHAAVRLDRLSTEVTAGFVQLLVPLLRETYGTLVQVKRRTATHVLSDLILSIEAADSTKQPHFLVL
ncbi:hypothetical protein AeMF1_011800 [Aphanomyces euteiches]|nr:hypothetical protein AeMF1_011800 [Aphanomyces euteiches]KAH9191748.1 hypothetical protein AeNC1_006265 [Aphanomyces euteiches]